MSDTPDNATAKIPENDARMSLWEHLDELRKRIVRAAIGLGVCTIGAWAFRTEILALLIKPYEHAWNERFPDTKFLMQTLGPADPFVGFMQLSLVAGAIVSVPVMFYQLWAFISPGLYAKEKRLIFPFVFFSTVLFLSGVSFAYTVGIPFTARYFLSLLGPVGTGGAVLTQQLTLEFLLDFTTRFLLCFGLVFELPLFIAFLVLAGLVTPKQLLKFGRWAILLSFVVGAIVTPGPEVTSQIAVSGALVGLYFLSILIAFMLKPVRKPEAP